MVIIIEFFTKKGNIRRNFLFQSGICFRHLSRICHLKGGLYCHLMFKRRFEIAQSVKYESIRTWYGIPTSFAIFLK